MAGWPVESIPDPDGLLKRVPRAHVTEGRPDPAAFRGQGERRGMSTDWERYSDPEATRRRSRTKPASEYGVVRLVAGEARAVPGQSVEHTPLPENRAHTDVFGEKDAEVRVKLSRIASWVLRLES